MKKENNIIRSCVAFVLEKIQAVCIIMFLSVF